MFEELLGKSKEKWESFAQQILTELKEQYEAFSKELVDDLMKRKSELELGVEKLEAEQSKKTKELDVISQEIIQIAEGTKKEREKLDNYQKKQDELLGKILEMEAREKDILIGEENLKQRDGDLLKKEEEIKIQLVLLDEKQRNLKKIWEKVQQM